MVSVYNEIVKRLEHPTCTMRAYTGNILRDQNYEIKGFPTSESFGEFDFVVVVVSHDFLLLLSEPIKRSLSRKRLTIPQMAIDCFEILRLSPSDRHKQLLESLQALVEPLNDGGTLLIIDMERVAREADEVPILGGKKMTGYHSSDIVNALGDMDVEGVDVLGDKRFEWVRTLLSSV